MEGCLSTEVPRQQLESFSNAHFHNVVNSLPHFNGIHCITNRYKTCRSYDDQSLGSSVADLIQHQSMDSFFPANHQGIGVSFQTRSIQQSSPVIVPSSHYTFDIGPGHDLKAPVCSPYVSYSRITPGCKLELDASTSSTDSWYSSQTHFPYHIDNNTNDFCHVASLTTCDTSIGDNPCTANVCRDIFEYLENVCRDGSSTGWERDSPCSSQTAGGCLVDTISTSNDCSNCQREHEFQVSPSPASRVLFDKIDEPLTSSHTIECFDFAEGPQQTSNTTWCSNYSTATQTAPEQTCSSVSGSQFTSLTTAGRMFSEADYQQQSAINTAQLQTPYNSQDQEKFRTFCQLDLLRDFSPTSCLKTTNALSQNRFIITSDSSELIRVSNNSGHPKSSAIFSSHHVLSPAESAKVHCRQLLNHASCYQIQYDYKMRQKLLQEQGGFQQNPPQTSCAVLESDHFVNKLFSAPNQLDFDKDSTSMMRDISKSFCRKRSPVTPIVRSSPLEECFPVTNYKTPNFTPQEIGSTSDDISCYQADEEHRVRKNSQQHHDMFQTTSPHTLCVAAYNKDTTTTPTLPNVSPGDVERALITSCRRCLFDETSCYRVVRKKSASTSATAVHRCHVCGRAYTRPSTLRAHIRARHSTAPKPHVCSVCGRRFTQLSNLDAHRRTHTGERPYECPVAGCGRRFTQSSSLSTHMRVHAGLRPYVCTYARCGRAFTDSSTLTKHVRVHTGVRPYHCDVCHAAFSQSGNLRRHQQRIHITSASPFR